MEVVIQDSSARCGLAARHMSRRTQTKTTRSEARNGHYEPLPDHDPALLVAALEAVEARRLALEWLLEADLLRLCLV